MLLISNVSRFSVSGIRSLALHAGHELAQGVENELLIAAVQIGSAVAVGKEGVTSKYGIACEVANGASRVSGRFHHDESQTAEYERVRIFDDSRLGIANDSLSAEEDGRSVFRTVAKKLFVLCMNVNGNLFDFNQRVDCADVPSILIMETAPLSRRMKCAT